MLRKPRDRIFSNSFSSNNCSVGTAAMQAEAMNLKGSGIRHYMIGNNEPFLMISFLMHWPKSYMSLFSVYEGSPLAPRLRVLFPPSPILEASERKKFTPDSKTLEPLREEIRRALFASHPQQS